MSNQPDKPVEYRYSLSSTGQRQLDPVWTKARRWRLAVDENDKPLGAFSLSLVANYQEKAGVRILGLEAQTA